MTNTELESFDELRAIVYLPENTVEAEIICKVYEDGKLVTASTTLSLADLRRAFEDAKKNYMEDDDTFELTDKGRQYLEWLYAGDVNAQGGAGHG